MAIPRSVPSWCGPALAVAVFALVLGLRAVVAPPVRAAAASPASAPPAAPSLPAEVRLDGGAASLDELGRRVVKALGRGDSAGLRALAITRSEHRDIVFPGRAADPGAGADFYYDNLAAGSLRDLARAQAELGGKSLEFRSIRARGEEAERRGEAVIHRGVELRVAVDGQERALGMLGGVVELRGAFKVTRYRKP
jgi:hypothetical protein